MAFSFQPATREPSVLLIGIAGPTGSGKTYSALRLARGITNQTGGKIAFIDTERGRAKQYAPDNLGYNGFDFFHCPIGSPYSAERYQEAFDEGEKVAGQDGVLIIDSMSHEHEGDGGLLDQHDDEADRMAKGDPKRRQAVSGFAWVKPKKKRRDFVNRVIQARCHVICCFRAKQKVKMVKNDKGKQEIVPIGWQPITGDDWPYEMTIMCLMDDQNKGTPIFATFDAGKCPENLRKFFKPGRQMCEDLGKDLAVWAKAGVDDKPVSSKNDHPAKENHQERTMSGNDMQPDAQDDDGSHDVPEEVKVVYDELSEEDVDYLGTPKEAAVALAARMKKTSYFYASRMLTLNSEWISQLDIDWQDRLEVIVNEKQAEEQARG